MKIEDLLKLAPEIHMDGTITFGLVPDVLQFIERNISEDSVTIETGAGFSTILFAIKKCKHVCVTPVYDEVKRIKHFCDAHNISTENVRFQIERSEDFLPRLDDNLFDLGLVDGGHGFPIPFIDYFYINRKIKDQGLLIIDDTRVWPIYLLREFMIHDDCWKCEFEIPNKTSCFRKLRRGSEAQEWIEQPFVMRKTEEITKQNSRAQQILRIRGHIRRLEFGVLAAKALRRLLRGIKRPQ